MSSETINTITQWLSLFTLIGAIAGSVIIVGTAVYQSLKARTVRWDVLGFILVLLWSFPYGIRNYGPELMDASIDLINTMATRREPLEAALKNLIGDTGEGQQAAEPTTQIIMQPAVTSTPNQYDVTATVFFATALPVDPSQPTETPRPMIEPTRTVVPSPTAFVCKNATADDLARGCLPPTPAPGN